MADSDLKPLSVAPGAPGSRKESRIPVRTPRPPRCVKPQPSVEPGSRAPEQDSRSSKTSPPHTSKPRSRQREKKASKSGAPKENVPPASARRPAQARSTMSYMELKKRHEELVSEIREQGSLSREADSQHQSVVQNLLGEIEGYRKNDAALKDEISSYKAQMEKRSCVVEELQQQLDEIELENTKLTALLEGARIDAASGQRVEKSVQFKTSEDLRERELESQERQLDSFISSLESTLARLQDHHTKTEQVMQ